LICIVDIFNISEHSVGGIHPACISVKKHYIDDRLTTQRYWVKKSMEHEVEGSRPRGRPKKTWEEVVREDCQARKLNKEDAMARCKWRKMIKEAR